MGGAKAPGLSDRKSPNIDQYEVTCDRSTAGSFRASPTHKFKLDRALDSPMEYELRKKRLEKLFQEVIVPETNKTLTRAGIKELAEAGMFILPAVKKELGLGE